MNPSVDDQTQQASRAIERIVAEVGKVIVGQTQLVERLLIGLLCNGHLLIEGVPGLAKTLAVRSLADAINVRFSRIQFTPDLLPADLIGTMIYNLQKAEFTTRLGPIFANIVLADEINRAPAKVQSALLEAMQERQVSIGGTTYPLDDPFMVLATQNPIEQEGTYPLPEAQVDRFMLKVIVSYPDRRDERLILDRMTAAVPPSVQRVIEPEEVFASRRAAQQVFMDDRLKDYIVDLILATREPRRYHLDGLEQLITYGASPRATIYLAQAAKAQALVRGRSYVIPEDIKDIAPDILRHRIIITYEAEAEDLTSQDIIQRVLSGVEVP